MEKFPKYGGFGRLGPRILGLYDKVGVSGVSLPATSWCWGCLASGRGLCELVVGGGGGSTECSLRVASWWLVRSWDSAALLLLWCQALLGMVQSARQELITSWKTKFLNQWNFADSITSTITAKQNISCNGWGKWRLKIVEKSATLGESADIDSLATKVALRSIMSTFPPIVNFGHKMLLKRKSYVHPMYWKFCLQTKLLTFLCSQELRSGKRKAGLSAQAHCAVGRIHVIWQLEFTLGKLIYFCRCLCFDFVWEQIFIDRS